MKEEIMNDGNGELIAPPADDTNIAENSDTRHVIINSAGSDDDREETAAQVEAAPPNDTPNALLPVARKNFLPMTITPNFDAIPQALKDLRRWLCWQLRLKPKEPGKKTKIPMTPKNGQLVFADVTNSENWLTFGEAISYYKRGLCTGIGFALTDTAPKVCCVDVDHCFDENGELTAAAKDVIALCDNSFVEKSQSGSGIHIWFIDEDFYSGRKKGNVEVYANNRYIAITGVRVQSSSTELLTVNGACHNVIAKFIDADVDKPGLFDNPARAADDKVTITFTADTNAPLSDDDRRLVEYLRSDECKDRDPNIFNLFNGNLAEYFKAQGKVLDDSVADCDLLIKLLWYVGGEGSDADIGQRALKVFGQSELAKRGKWQDRGAYRLSTFNFAFGVWVKGGRKAGKSGTTDTAAQSSNTKKTKAQKVQEAIDKINEKRKDAQARLVELRNAPDTPENREEIRRLIRNLCDWHRDKLGNPTLIKSTVSNMDLILDNDKALRDIVGYNEFFGEMVVLKDLFWRKDSAGTEWTDRDEAQFRTYLRRNYCELKSPETIHDCLIDLSQRNAFHPVKDFFNSLPEWDGINRAETLFIDFLKADDTPFTREVTLNWLTAAVARIFYPGVDYQLAPILLGQQGIGKSYLLNKLGGKWYGALFDDVNDPHAIDAIQRLWFCEIKEMASMKKDVDANKRFLDTAVDTRRAPYDRYATATPRHCVFAITTNNRQCLNDMTGNRRYPVIECKAKPGEYVDGLNDKFISQLWAEVYRLFKEKFDGVRDIDSVGRGLELSREVKKQVLTTAETYTRDDGLESVIKGFLDTCILPPVLWKLLTREERRKFIADGKLVMENAMRDFNLRSHSRWQGKNRYDSNPDIDLIYKAIKPTSSNPFVHVDEKKFGEKTVAVYTVYGSELRQHISAAEIYEECFGNDRRKTPARIYEVLSQLDGWALGKRIRNDDPCYRDQKKVYYRQSTEDSKS